MNKKAQSGLVGAIIGLTVAVIVGAAVAVPITLSLINESFGGPANQTNVPSATTLTILNLLPLAFALILLVAIFAAVVIRR